MNTSKTEEKLPQVLVCECHSTEHQLILQFDEQDKAIYVSVHLTDYQGFFKRLWVGIKYAFGYKSKYGHFDEVLLTDRHLPILKDAVQFLETPTTKQTPPVING